MIGLWSCNIISCFNEEEHSDLLSRVFRQFFEPCKLCECHVIVFPIHFIFLHFISIVFSTICRKASWPRAMVLWTLGKGRRACVALVPGSIPRPYLCGVVLQTAVLEFQKRKEKKRLHGLYVFYKVCVWYSTYTCWIWQVRIYTFEVLMFNSLNFTSWKLKNIFLVKQDSAIVIEGKEKKLKDMVIQPLGRKIS